MKTHILDGAPVTEVKPENPPAFPNPHREFVDPLDHGMREIMNHANAGMTLRDYFAGRALTGMLASDRDGYDFNGDCDARAIACYEMADAMLAARNKSTPSE